MRRVVVMRALFLTAAPTLAMAARLREMELAR